MYDNYVKSKYQRLYFEIYELIAKLLVHLVSMKNRSKGYASFRSN